MQAADAAALPADVELAIAVVPPLSNCPHCAADLPEGATECRRCGERIRLCHGLRDAEHLAGARLPTEARPTPCGHRRTGAWRRAGMRATPWPLRLPLGAHLARRWSFPTSAPTRAADALEWSAPLAAFGMVIASAIDSEAGRASIYAFALANGAALWDFDLPDGRGLYPDRGAMALSEDGMLYAATLGGAVLAMDVIRGTRRWEAKVNGPVYGGVTVTGGFLLVPSGTDLVILDRADGRLVCTLPVGGQLDTAPAAWGGGVFVGSDDGHLRAFDLASGAQVWATETDGPFDAAPLVRDGVVYAATMTGTVWAVESATGAVRWKTNVSSRAVSVSPALSFDGLLYVGSDDGFLHIVAANTGNLIRSRRVSASPLRCAPGLRGPHGLRGRGRRQPLFAGRRV